MGVSKNKGIPKRMVKIMEISINMDDLGGPPLFLEIQHILSFQEFSEVFRALGRVLMEIQQNIVSLRIRKPINPVAILRTPKHCYTGSGLPRPIRGSSRGFLGISILVPCRSYRHSRGQMLVPKWDQTKVGPTC